MSVATQSSTSGILNYICERYRVNSRENSVSIQQLIKFHQPKQNAELVALIESHQATGKHCNCPCGAKSKGNLLNFSKNLLNFYEYHKKSNSSIPPKSFQDCQQYIYNLFIVNSLKGAGMEIKVKRYLNENLLNLSHSAELSNELYDVNYGIDILIKNKNGLELCGIQVKPLSYKDLSSTNNIVKQNIQRNLKYHKKIFYIYYDKDLNIIENQELRIFISNNNT